MNILSIKLPKVIDEKLTTTAKRRKQAKTAVIDEALQEYFARQEQKPLTVGELAKEYIGIIDDDGPANLSSNKKHMEGYGQ